MCMTKLGGTIIAAVIILTIYSQLFATIHIFTHMWLFIVDNMTSSIFIRNSTFEDYVESLYLASNECSNILQYIC